MKKVIVNLIICSILTGCGSHNLTSNQLKYNFYTPNNQIYHNNSFSNFQNNSNNNDIINNNLNRIDKNNSKEYNIPVNDVVNKDKESVTNKTNKSSLDNTKYKGYIVIGLKQGFGEKDGKNLVSKYNLIYDRYIKGINLVIANVNSKYSLKDITDKLLQENIVSFVEPDKIGILPPDKETTFEIKDSFSILSVGPDKYLDQQYGLNAIHVFNAWQKTLGSPSIKIAVIDTGVEISHPDLKNNIHPGYDAFSKKEGIKSGDVSTLNYIISMYKHGTHVAGIAAAEYNNNKGIAGVAPRCKIMPIKVFPDGDDIINSILGKNNNNQQTLLSAVADGIVWAVDHGASVINMSLGTQEESQTIKLAVEYALSRNVPVVVSAGNERQQGNPRNFLAAIPGVIGVGATDQYNRITPFSNSGDYVSVCAPGYEIISTVPSFLNLRAYTKYSGTSMAAPHVAGVIALMKSINKNLTPEEIKNKLQNTALDLGAVGRDDLYGYGLINAYEAIKDLTNL